MGVEYTGVEVGAVGRLEGITNNSAREKKVGQVEQPRGENAVCRDELERDVLKHLRRQIQKVCGHVSER